MTLTEHCNALVAALRAEGLTVEPCSPYELQVTEGGASVSVRMNGRLDGWLVYGTPSAHFPGLAPNVPKLVERIKARLQERRDYLAERQREADRFTAASQRRAALLAELDFPIDSPGQMLEAVK